MVTTQEIIDAVLDAPRDTDILNLLQDKGIAWRSFSSDIFMELHAASLKHVDDENERKYIVDRLAFLIRYVSDFEFKALPDPDAAKKREFGWYRVETVKPGKYGEKIQTHNFETWGEANKFCAEFDKENADDPKAIAALWVREQ